MEALDKLGEMKAAAQANLDALSALEGQVQLLDTPAYEDLKAQLEKAKVDIEALVAERDLLRAAIQAEIDDDKAQTDRLEKAIAPVEVAAAPVIPEVPVAQPAPTPVPLPVVDAPKPDDTQAPVADAPKADDNTGHNVEVEQTPVQ